MKAKLALHVSIDQQSVFRRTKYSEPEQNELLVPVPETGVAQFPSSVVTPDVRSSITSSLTQPQSPLTKQSKSKSFDPFAAAQAKEEAIRQLKQ